MLITLAADIISRQSGLTIPRRAGTIDSTPRSQTKKETPNLFERSVSMITTLFDRVQSRAGSLTLQDMFHVSLDHLLIVVLFFGAQSCSTSLQQFDELRAKDNHDGRIFLQGVEYLKRADLCIKVVALLWVIRVYGPMTFDLIRTILAGLRHILLAPWIAITIFFWPHLKDALHSVHDMKSRNDMNISEIKSVYHPPSAHEANDEDDLPKNGALFPGLFVSSNPRYEIPGTYVSASSNAEETGGRPFDSLTTAQIDEGCSSELQNIWEPSGKRSPTDAQVSVPPSSRSYSVTKSRLAALRKLSDQSKPRLP